MINLDQSIGKIYEYDKTQCTIWSFWCSSDISVLLKIWKNTKTINMLKILKKLFCGLVVRKPLSVKDERLETSRHLEDFRALASIFLWNNFIYDIPKFAVFDLDYFIPITNSAQHVIKTSFSTSKIMNFRPNLHKS